MSLERAAFYLVTRISPNLATRLWEASFSATYEVGTSSQIVPCCFSERYVCKNVFYYSNHVILIRRADSGKGFFLKGEVLVNQFVPVGGRAK